MNTDTLEELESIISQFEKKLPQILEVERVKSLCNTFALEMTDDDIIDYMSMMEYSMSTFEFRMLMIRIYESI